MLSVLLSWICLAGPEPAAAWVQDPPPPAEEKAAEPKAEEPQPAAPAEESPWFAVTGGDVHTVTGGVLRGATVLCREGRIVAVGSGLVLPEGARRLDARGLQVYPGLVAVNSSGLVRGSGVAARDAFDPFALNLDLALTGGLTTVVGGDTIVKLTRGTLDGHYLGTRPWVDLNVSPTTPAGRREVAARLGKAREFLRLRRDWRLRKELGEVEGEEPKPEGVGEDDLALLEGRSIARFSANSQRDLLAVCELIEEFPMQAVIFGGREAWTVAGRLGRTGARLVLQPRDKAWADDTRNAQSGWTIENARILHEHGVEFAILPTQAGVSTGGIIGRDLMTLPIEAAFEIRGGLPQAAALRALTLDAAKVLGLEGRLGSLEPGKDADLIVCDGDLFDYRTFVQWTVVNGRIAYDKQKAPYFAHIRPRPEATAEEVLEAIRKAAEAQVAAAEQAPPGADDPEKRDHPR